MSECECEGECEGARQPGRGRRAEVVRLVHEDDLLSVSVSMTC